MIFVVHSNFCKGIWTHVLYNAGALLWVMKVLHIFIEEENFISEMKSSSSLLYLLFIIIIDTTNNCK